MMVTIEKVAEVEAKVGEGPVWDAADQKLLWTDIHNGRLFSYDPATNRYEKIHQGFNVGGFAVNRQGGLVACIWDGVVLWRSDDDWVRITGETHEGAPLRFNDVTADPEGRMFGGSYLDTGPGKLYRIDPDGSVQVMEEGVGCSNGMGFSPDLKTMYYTDSNVRTIYAYDYDRKTGAMSNRRVFVKLADTEGVPDGMTVDAEGYVWTALWFGGCIVRFDPDGKEERRIRLPAYQTSSVMFGGRDLTDIYVTTANFLIEPGSPIDPADYDWASYRSGYRGGGLFRVRQEIQGREEFQANFAWPAQ
jgi:D-xylonolactonase